MTNSDHNKLGNGASRPISTLADLRDYIATCDLPADTRSQLRSAIKRADELVGHGALDLPANLRLILERLEGWSPAMSGMSPGALANLKSRIRFVMRLAEPRLANGTRRHKLDGAWRALYEGLDMGAQRYLSRLFRLADQQDWKPEELSDAHVERFASHLRETELVSGWEAVVRNSIREWNKLVENGKHGALKPLTAPPAKRTLYWIDVSAWPEGLRGDLHTFLADLAKPSCFTGKPVRDLETTTIEQYRYVVITLVSAAIGNGAELAGMKRLGDAVKPENLNRALMFLHERAGGVVTTRMVQLAMRARVIGAWCKLPNAELDRLAEMFTNVKEQSSVRRGMTRKNRALLDRLDDLRFNDLVHLLPQLLFSRANACPKAKWAAAMVRTALAIELLLTCSMRRENLVTLELDRSIRRIGKPPEDFWVVEIEAEHVKNDEPLRFTLPEPTVKLLEAYLDHWRLKLCTKSSPWLFPAADGGCIDPRAMAHAIQTESRRVLGVAVSPHQFRHLSAECYLLENPDALYTISQHLGHRDPNTTRTYYARPKQRQASRRYQEHVLQKRAQAEIRVRRGRRRTNPLSDVPEDVL